MQGENTNSVQGGMFGEEPAEELLMGFEKILCHTGKQKGHVYTEIEEIGSC